MTQAKFTEPPCGHPREQVRLLGLPGSCSLASETRQPSAHSHGYRAGKGWLWWHRHGTGVALSSAGHDASVEQLWASTGQISPLLPPRQLMACGVRGKVSSPQGSLWKGLSPAQPLNPWPRPCGGWKAVGTKALHTSWLSTDPMLSPGLAPGQPLAVCSPDPFCSPFLSPNGGLRKHSLSPPSGPC